MSAEKEKVIKTGTEITSKKNNRYNYVAPMQTGAVIFTKNARLIKPVLKDLSRYNKDIVRILKGSFSIIGELKKSQLHVKLINPYTYQAIMNNSNLKQHYMDCKNFVNNSKTSYAKDQLKRDAHYLVRKIVCDMNIRYIYHVINSAFCNNIYSYKTVDDKVNIYEQNNGEIHDLFYVFAPYHDEGTFSIILFKDYDGTNVRLYLHFKIMSIYHTDNENQALYLSEDEQYTKNHFDLNNIYVRYNVYANVFPYYRMASKQK